jgi:signal transduction histidine kinase/CheY-like chemotaxis protein
MRQFWAPGPVYAEQVRSSFGHLPLPLSVSVLNSALLGFVLASDVAATRILVWVGLVAALSMLRLGLWYAHGRLDVGPRHDGRWTFLATAGAFASGILWGSGAFVFAPLGEAHLLFLALVIGGMCAGAATVHAAHFPSVMAFIVPAILPLTSSLLMAPDRLHVVAGVMIAVFGVSLCIASPKFQRWFRDTTAARLALAEQTHETDVANDRFRNEIERHRSTEMKLQQALKMEAVGRLTAGIAHDFNNILMAIGGSAEALRRQLLAHPAERRLVETILRSVERGTGLTRQLLVFGRREPLLPRYVDINAMLLGMEELLVSTLGGYAKLELCLEQGSPPAAVIDANQLESAILNLVINAGDAMPDGGSVTIKTANAALHGTEGLAGEYVVISVADTGIGMTDEVRLRAFDPFFTTKEPGKGSGLGLSQVYGLIEQSGGTVRLDSRPGEGTTVSIFLPRVAHVATPLPTPPRRTARIAPAEPREGRRILLIDDDEPVRETLTEMLRQAGYTVAPFDAAPAAFDELAGPNRIDLVIVDFAMPTLRGDQFAAAARSRRAEVPVLFITGYAETDALEMERWVLRKPFSAAALITTVEEAMQLAA